MSEHFICKVFTLLSLLLQLLLPLLTVKNSKQKSLWLSIETNGRKTDLLRFSRIFVDSLLIDKVLLRFLNTFHLHTH